MLWQSMRLPPPDPLTTACVYIAALFMAVQQGLKGAPDFVARTRFPDLNAGVWNYLPLLLLSAGLLLWFFERIFRLGYASEAPAETPVLSRPREEAVPEPPAPSAEREYLPASFSKAFIALHRRDHTQAERNVMLRPHIGKWMRLPGYMAYVGSSSDRIHVIVHPVAKRTTGKETGMSVMFPATAEPLLAPIKINERMEIDVQIVDHHGSIDLRNAELR